MFCNYLFKFSKYLFLFLSLFFLISCENGQVVDKSQNFSQEDSIRFYYSESSNKEYDTSKKLENINRAYILQKKNLEDNSLLVYILNRKISIHHENGEHDSLNIYNNLLLKISTEIQNKPYQAKHYLTRAQYHNQILKDFDSAYIYFNTAKNLFIEINDSINAGKNLLNLAIIQKNKNDYYGSEQTAVDGLSYLQNLGSKDYIASLYNVIGTNRRKLLNYEDAVEDYHKAIALATNKKDILSYKNNLATTFNDLKDYQKSIQLLKGVLNDTLVVNKYPKFKARVIDNLAYARWLQNPKLNIENELMHAFSMRKSLNDQKGLIASYTRLTEYFLEKDLSKAINYSQKAIAISRKTGTPEAELDVLRIIMPVQPNNTRIRNRFINLKDSVDIVNKKVSTRFAKTKYDTKQAKKENEKLLRDNVIKDLENERQKQQKTLNATIAVAILIIALIYFYFLYKKHKREKVLQVYNTETRISKKVHDELANDVYNVMVVLQKELKNDNGSTHKVLNQVEDIYVRTRNISHENNSIDTGEEYTDSLREMIGDYNTDETAIIIKDIENPRWETIDNYKKIVVHRVLQELMVNMKKHSKATVVVLTFSAKEKKLLIQYSDNGIGLPFIKASKKGLLNMENRIQSVAGTLNFDSESGKGLKLSMSFPL